MKKRLGSILYLIFPKELGTENEKEFSWSEIITFYGLIIFALTMINNISIMNYGKPEFFKDSKTKLVE